LPGGKFIDFNIVPELVDRRTLGLENFQHRAVHQTNQNTSHVLLAVLKQVFFDYLQVYELLKEPS
jgi:hypothetical protein